MTGLVHNPLRELTDRSNHASTITRAIYAFLATHCFMSLRDWRIWFGEEAVNFQPVWPVAWLRAEAVPAFWVVATTTGLLLALMVIVRNESRPLRMTAAICLFLHFAIEDSRDAIRHGEHGLLWTALILACLPAMSPTTVSRRRQLRYLRVFGTAQIMFLLFYWMAGVVKVLTSMAQALQGERTLLHPDSGALIIAEWLLRGDARSLMGDWFVEHDLIAWLSVLGGVAIELLAITPLLWRRMQAIVGVGLIVMHVGIGLSMDVWFPENVALLGILILAGPAIATRSTWQVSVP